MKILNITILVFVLIILFSASTCSAGWVVFHKPEYRGRLIDAETKEPIEGAVVVAMYQKYPIISGPGGGSSEIIHIKEALTDEKGEFVIPSYWTLMGPNATEYRTEFIIYKPGYASFPNNSRDIYPFNYFDPSFLFTKKLDKVVEIRRSSGLIKITFGVAELPRLKTIKERLRTIPSPPTIEKKDTPLFYKSINEERISFGFEPVGR